MSAVTDCMEDILDGTARRVCQYNSEGGVHRGFIPDLHADYTAEGLFREDYTLDTVERAMTLVHQFARTNGAYINYVGPGPHKIVVPQRDTKTRPVLVRATSVDIISDADWQCDGVTGYTVEDKKTGDQFYVTGDARATGSHPGLFYVVDIVNGAERWLLTGKGVGVSPTQRMRLALGTIEWLDWIATLMNGLTQQCEVQGDAEIALNNRVLANTYWRTGITLATNQVPFQGIRATLQAEADQFRATIPWMEPASV